MVACREPDCKAKSNLVRYAPKGQKPIWCKAHKIEGCVDVRQQLCKYKDCGIRSGFGDKATKKAEFCAEHAPEDYIDVRHKLCEHPECGIRASYGKKGSKKPEFCITHKPTEYVDVVSKLCEHPNCETQPSYGKEGTKKAEYCKDHAPEDYVDVANKRCDKPGCGTQASYGKPGSKTKEYCRKHAPPYYVDVSNTMCLFPDCGIRPNFGMPDSKTAEFCEKHAPKDYINVLGKYCKHPDCGVQATYSYPGYSAEYCTTHKLPRMVHNPASKPKEETQICTYCSTEIHYNEEFCSGCKRFITLQTTVKCKMKEDRVAAVLSEAKIDFVNDQRAGRSRKRPDFQIKASWGTIIVEVDEFQHRGMHYLCKDEVSRMLEIYEENDEWAMIFVRYNPDSYKSDTECVPLRARERHLVELIRDMLENGVDYRLSVLYLYYDHYVSDEPEEIEI